MNRLIAGRESAHIESSGGQLFCGRASRSGKITNQLQQNPRCQTAALDIPSWYLSIRSVYHRSRKPIVIGRTLRLTNTWLATGHNHAWAEACHCDRQTHRRIRSGITNSHRCDRILSGSFFVQLQATGCFGKQSNTTSLWHISATARQQMTVRFEQDQRGLNRGVKISCSACVPETCGLRVISELSVQIRDRRE